MNILLMVFCLTFQVKAQMPIVNGRAKYKRFNHFYLNKLVALLSQVITGGLVILSNPQLINFNNKNKATTYPPTPWSLQ
jgi:hypothetical protein